MPFHVENALVILEGHCSVEEAPDLFQALLAIEDPVFETAGARTLHTAVAQLLLASGGRLRSRPREPVLAACLAPLPSA